MEQGETIAFATKRLYNGRCVEHALSGRRDINDQTWAKTDRAEQMGQERIRNSSGGFLFRL